MLRIEDDGSTIFLVGELDAADRAAFLDAARAMRARRRGGTLDVSGLEVWDLATYQLTLALRRDVSATGEHVRLVGQDAPSAAILGPLGLSDALTQSLHWEVW